MTALLSIINGSNELTLDSGGWFPRYLGQATFAGVQPVSGSGDLSTSYQNFTFSHAAQIIPVVRLTNGLHTRVRYLSNSGSSWTIQVCNKNTTVDANNFGNEVQATVYVFGFPVTPAGTSGMLMWRPDGTLSADLSARPMVFSSRQHFSNTDTALTIPALSTPVVFGANRSARRRVTSAGVGASNVFMDAGSWTTNAGGSQLIKSFVQEQRYFIDAVPGSVTLHRACTAFTLEGAGL